VIRYFAKTLRSHLRKGLSLYLLTLLGVALGVASVLAIQMINRSSIGAFRGGLRAVGGETDLSVQGLEPRIPEHLLAQVLSTRGIANAWPICEYDVQTHTSEPFHLRILAMDLLRPLPLWNGTDGVPEEVLSVPGWIAVGRQLAQQMNWKEGSVIPTSMGSRRFELTVGAVVDFRRFTPQANSRLVLMDIAQAQSLLGGKGWIHRIDVTIQEEAVLEEVAGRLKDRLGDGTEILTPQERMDQAEGLLHAFRLNLTALSLISLFVAVFLIYSSTQASLVRRRRELGLLRSLGATPAQVLFLILGEAILLGILGVAIGIPGGYWLAEASLGAVNTTLTNIYLLDEIENVQFPAVFFWLAVGIGVGSALFGTLLPALDMSRKDTAALLAAFTLREGITKLARPLLIVSIVVLIGTTLLCWAKGFSWKPGGFILGVALLISLPLASPYTVLRVCGGIRVRDFGLRYCMKSLADRVQTTAFAVASLGIAVTMMVGITLMVGSFRETLGIWVETTIAADLYVTSSSWRGAGSSATLDVSLVDRIESHDGVRAVDRIRAFPYRYGERRIILSGVDLTVPLSRSRYPLLSGNPVSTFERLKTGEGVLISEPLARKASLDVGDPFELFGQNGKESIEILGVMHDYTSDSGLVVMSFSRMDTIFGESEANSLALYLEEGVDLEKVEDSLNRELSEYPLRISSNRMLRGNILEIFDQTFAVVRILQVVSLLIALSGITLTLLILARERISELALYRALGAERGQIFRIYLGKGISIALLSSVLGSLGGLALALILVFWINRAYFGWTIRLSVPWWDLGQELALILLVAAIASVYPAMRASETPATELNRDDL